MIYIVQNNEQSGPYSEEEIRQKLIGGAVSSDDLAWKQGLSDWQPLSSFFNIPRHRTSVRQSQVLLAVSVLLLVGIVLMAAPQLQDLASDLIPRKPPLSLDEVPLTVEPQPNVDRALVFLRYIDDCLDLPQPLSEDGTISQNAADDYLRQLHLAQEYLQEEGLDQELQAVLQERQRLFLQYLQIHRSQLNVTEDHQIRETQEIAEGSFNSGFKGGQAAAALVNGGGSLAASALVGLSVYAMDMWLTQSGQAAQRDRAYEERMRPLSEEWRHSLMAADTKFRKVVQTLGARHNWFRSDTGVFIPKEQTDAVAEAMSSQNIEKLSSLWRREREARPRDPFVAFSSAAADFFIANSSKADASSYAQIEKTALQAVALLPPDDFYDQFRSKLYSLAAYSVLEQTKLSTKGAGYIRGPFDSSRCFRLFKAALKFDPYDATGSTRRGLGIAYALAGHFDNALAQHEQVRVNFAEDPKFQVDLARLYALNGKGQESLAAIEKLIRLPDFSDITLLRSDDDLQQLRGNDEKALEELTSVKTKAIIDMGYSWSDVILRNESPFPLTNVRFTPRIWQNGKVFSRELLRERLAPGESYNWSGEIKVTKDENGHTYDSCDYTIVCDQGTVEVSVAKE